MTEILVHFIIMIDGEEYVPEDDNDDDEENLPEEDDDEEYIPEDGDYEENLPEKERNVIEKKTILNLLSLRVPERENWLEIDINCYHCAVVRKDVLRKLMTNRKKWYTKNFGI